MKYQKNENGELIKVDESVNIHSLKLPVSHMTKDDLKELPKDLTKLLKKSYNDGDYEKLVKFLSQAVSFSQSGQNKNLTDDIADRIYVEYDLWKAVVGIISKVEDRSSFKKIL